MTLEQLDVAPSAALEDAVSDRASRPARSGSAAADHEVLARNAGYLLLAQVVSTALSVVLSAALARHLGATDFGTWFLIVTTSTFAYVFVEWGQSAYLIREAARRPAEVGALLGSALVFRALGGASVTVLAMLVTRVLGYDARIQALTGLMVVCALPLALAQPFCYLFRGRDRMDLDAVVSVAAKVLTVAITLPVLLHGGHLVSVIAVQGVAGVGALAVASLLSRRLHLPAPRATRQGLCELAVGGTSIAVFFAAIAGQPYIDAVILSKLAPGHVMGWYGAAKNIMGLLVTPAAILAAAAFPQLSRAASDPEQLRRAVRMALRPIVVLGTLAGIGTFLFAGPVVALIYGPGGFAPSATVLELFAPMLLLFFVDMMLGGVVTAIGRTRTLAVAKLLNVALSTALGILLVPPCQARLGNGGLGIVLAFGISEFVMLGAYLWVIPSGALGREPLLDIGRALLAGAGTVALFRVLPPVSLWVALPAAVTTFALLTWAVGFADPAAPMARFLRPRWGSQGVSS
jgi:O-antigen/teichoic acid export membrane protein